ncbi:MAG: hypothetical protein RL219_2106 [Actinomycetota bacterium]
MGAGLVVCAFVLAACSSGSSNSSGDATTTVAGSDGAVQFDLTTLPPAGAPLGPTVRNFDLDFLDLLWTNSGASAEFPAAYRDALVDAYSAVNAESIADTVAAPGGPRRAPRSAALRSVTPRQTDAGGSFAGFLEQMGANFGKFEQQLSSGRSGTQTAQFDKELQIPGENGSTVVAKVKLNVTLSLSGSKAKISGSLTGDLRTVGKSGETLATFALELRAEASVTLCPDLDGMARVEGSLTGSGTFGGTGIRGTLELSSSGTVGDDAYLSGVEWRSRGRLELTGSGSDFVEVGLTGTSSVKSGKVDTFANASSVAGTDSDSSGIGLLSQAERVVLAQYVSAEALGSFALNFAQSMWREGFCLEIRTTEESSTVSPGETVQFTATVWHKFDAREEDHPIEGYLSGERELTPKDGPQAPPVLFRYLAPAQSGGKHSVGLSTVSRRGIAYKTLDFQVGKQGYRPEVSEYAGGYVNPTGGTCDPSKPWTMAVEDENGVLRLSFDMTPSGADGLAGAVRVTATVVDSDFRAIANSTYRISAVPAGLGAPPGSKFFEWGPAPLVPTEPGGFPLTIPQLKYLLVPDAQQCAGSSAG